MMNITDEDRKIVHDYIIHNLTIRRLQSEIKEAGKSNVKMKRVYLSANQYQESQALKQLKELRKEMSQRGLRIVGEHTADNDIIEFRYLCRGVPLHICFQEEDLHKLLQEKRFELLC
jgi:flagellar motor component MotA